VTEPTQGTVELDGRRWVYLERVREGVTEKSFDGGETWGENPADVYRRARAAGKLRPESDSDAPAELPEEAASVMLELGALIRAMRPGDEVRIVHTGAAVHVIKNKVALAFRPSVFADGAFEGTGEE
jgi:hypothetical protein